MQNITIMICTYNRVEDLNNTLMSLRELNYDIEKINIVIVDNDYNGSAKCIVDKYKKFLNITYAIEMNKGISYARNRCLEIAKTIECRYVAFIDDDEVVSKEWLKELIKVINNFKGDIVRGPVIRTYPEDVPKWVVKSKVFENQILEDGTVLDICFTGNVLMKKEIILSQKFDEKYALSGGEDTKFFMNLNKKGKKIVYAKNAVIYEKLDENRLKFSYILHRAFRDSVNYVSIQKEVYNVSDIKVILKAIIKMIAYLIYSPISLLGGYKEIVKTIIKVVSAYGNIYGIITKKTVKGY